jgi:hypothetical protein
VVRAAPPQAPAGAGELELEEPAFWRILRRGLGLMVVDGALPLGAFYLAWRAAGLGAGIAASTAASAAIWGWQRRRGSDSAFLRLSFAFVLVQAAIGLLSRSETVYLAQPVLLNAVWGCVFAGSAFVGRPLAGAIGRAWYPFPDWVLASRGFRRVYGFESVVWGLYLAGRAALRLAALLHGGVDSFFVVSIVTGTPTMVLLLAWSVWYAIRRLPRELSAA